jgi:hypothetical protein
MTIEKVLVNAAVVTHVQLLPKTCMLQLRLIALVNKKNINQV